MITHAAGESSPGNLIKNTYAVVLAARDLKHLHVIRQHLHDCDVPHVLIEEEGEPMAIGVVPDSRSKLKRHLSSLPLLR